MTHISRLRTHTQHCPECRDEYCDAALAIAVDAALQFGLDDPANDLNVTEINTIMNSEDTDEFHDC